MSDIRTLCYFMLLITINISLSLPSCHIGENHCSKCNPVTKLCVRCEKDIYIPDKNGGCENSQKCIIGMNHCNECNEEETLCNKCETGYYPDENGGCSYTPNCELSYKGKCLKCKNNFILIGQERYISIERGYVYFADIHLEINEGTQICKSLDSEDLKNCHKVNGLSGKCEECNEGFYLNSGDKRCTTIENCEKSSFGICKKCTKGYYLNIKENKCIKQNENLKNCKESFNDLNCDVCEDEFYFDDNYMCIYINHCENGDVGGGCQTCSSGYYLTKSGDSCTKDTNCYSGNRHIGICNKCIEGYYLDNLDGKCKSNQEDNDFKYCKEADLGICNNCIYGYELGIDSKCSSSKLCAESENGKCIECIDDYYLGLDNMCTNVKHCIYSKGYICIECENDFYYDQSAMKCNLAKGNFTNCKYGLESENYCVTCKDNYYLNLTDYLCYSSEGKDNFNKCEKTDFDGIYCSECIEGYYLSNKDKKCSNIKGCNILEDENRCSECDNDFCLDIKTGKCEDVIEIKDEDKKFYFRCNKTNAEGSECEICNPGYELKNGVCVDEEHCAEKDENGNCKKCLNDEDNSFCLNPTFGCVERFFDNCLQCDDVLDFDKCNACIEGFELDLFNRCIEIE